MDNAANSSRSQTHCNTRDHCQQLRLQNELSKNAPHRRVPFMILYKILGFLFLGLEFIGAFLPLLPTTPFVLLAAGCFAKSSERWYRWLLANRLFGPMIIDWENHQCISCNTRRIAVVSLLLFGGYGLFFTFENPYLIMFAASVIILSLLSILKLKLCEQSTDP